MTVVRRDLVKRTGLRRLVSAARRLTGLSLRVWIDVVFIGQMEPHVPSPRKAPWIQQAYTRIGWPANVCLNLMGAVEAVGKFNILTPQATGASIIFIAAVWAAAAVIARRKGIQWQVNSRTITLRKLPHKAHLFFLLAIFAFLWSRLIPSKSRDEAGNTNPPTAGATDTPKTKTCSDEMLNGTEPVSQSCRDYCRVELTRRGVDWTGKSFRDAMLLGNLDDLRLFFVAGKGPDYTDPGDEPTIVRFVRQVKEPGLVSSVLSLAREHGLDIDRTYVLNPAHTVTLAKTAIDYRNTAAFRFVWRHTKQNKTVQKLLKEASGMALTAQNACGVVGTVEEVESLMRMQQISGFEPPFEISSHKFIHNGPTDSLSAMAERGGRQRWNLILNMTSLVSEFRYAINGANTASRNTCIELTDEVLRGRIEIDAADGLGRRIHTSLNFDLPELGRRRAREQIGVSASRGLVVVRSRGGPYVMLADFAALASVVRSLSIEAIMEDGTIRRANLPLDRPSDAVVAYSGGIHFRREELFPVRVGSQFKSNRLSLTAHLVDGGRRVCRFELKTLISFELMGQCEVVH